MDMARGYLRQGRPDFSVGYKLQTRWGAMEAAIFTLECAGAALFALATWAGERLPAMAAGVALVAAAIILLLLHLGHPRRAWRALRKVRTSWISRGTVVLGGFVALGTIYIVLRQAGAIEFSTSLAAGVRWTLLAACAFILVYPGLILSASPAIPFWDSGLLPVLSAASGAASGAVLYSVFTILPGSEATAAMPPALSSGLLVALAVLAAIYVASMRQRGGTAAESVNCLMSAQLALFLGGGGLVGVVVPLLFAGGALGSGEAAVMIAAGGRLGGDFALRYALLKVGMFSPVV